MKSLKKSPGKSEKLLCLYVCWPFRIHDVFLSIHCYTICEKFCFPTSSPTQSPTSKSLISFQVSNYLASYVEKNV